jgi:hypothetical protein
MDAKINHIIFCLPPVTESGRHGRDHMVFGFTTTCAIIA